MATTRRRAPPKPTASKRDPVPPATATQRWTTRADLGADVDPWIAKLASPIRELVVTLKGIVEGAAPEASVAIKWGMPVFNANGLLCYLKPASGYVRLGFYEQGIHLTDPDGLLEGDGQQMRHLKIRRPEDIKPALFARWVREAVAINARRR